jgi:hypothetical protein
MLLNAGNNITGNAPNTISSKDFTGDQLRKDRLRREGGSAL